MILLLGFAFLSGIVTILTPCIWPLLPIILSSSAVGKSHKRPLGITLGIMLSFAVFTLFISFLVKAFNLDSNILRLISVIVIGFLGFSMIIPYLNKIMEGFISRLSGLAGQKGQVKGNDFLSGFVTGFFLGIVWSPCAGPILASIAALSAMGKVTISLVLVTGFYVLGVGIPLFIFSYGGQKIFAKTRFIASKTGIIQKIFGVIMILTAISIYTNYDKYIQVKILNLFPQFESAVNKFENSNAVKKQLNLLRGGDSSIELNTKSNELFNTNSTAPDFAGITKWLNSKPLTLKELKGKVVLVDFWTYTCINCIRTLPHVTSWYNKYKDQGFVVVGVHTPEFEFEKNTNNVLNAIKQYKINYPVAQDNNYVTWNNYNNQYWPAKYLIDQNGNIRKTHFGEGEYEEMEMAIQSLLKEGGSALSMSLDIVLDSTARIKLSRETYLGSQRMEFYYPSQNIGNGKKIFSLSENLPGNFFSLGGEWDITDENAITGKNAVLNYNFYADKVFLVLRPGSAEKNYAIKVFFDGKLAGNSNAGEDVKNGTVNVDSDRLYNIIDLKGNPGNHIIKLEFQSSGIEAFAFTFG